MKDFTHIIMWLFIASFLVLVVTHAKDFSTAVTAVGGQVTNDAYLLSGGAQAGGAPASWRTA